MKAAEENFKLHRAGSIEQETLAWLQDVVCAVHRSFGIAPDGPATERASHRKVLLLLLEHLREAIAHCHGGDASATAATAATGAGCTVSVVLPCL